MGDTMLSKEWRTVASHNLVLSLPQTTPRRQVSLSGPLERRSCMHQLVSGLRKTQSENWHGLRSTSSGTCSRHRPQKSSLRSFPHHLDWNLCVLRGWLWWRERYSGSDWNSTTQGTWRERQTISISETGERAVELGPLLHRLCCTSYLLVTIYRMSIILYIIAPRPFITPKKAHL